MPWDPLLDPPRDEDEPQWPTDAELVEQLLRATDELPADFFDDEL